MKQSFCCTAVVLLLALAAAPAQAEDVYGPDILFRGDANTTFQHWEFTTDQMTDIEPENYVNPYGTPTADIIGDNVEWADDWDAPPELNPPEDPFPGFHFPEGGTGIFLLFNDPEPRPKKVIIVQATASKEPLSVSLDLPPGITYQSVDVGLPTYVWGLPAPFDGEWATYVYAFDTSVNPEWESIVIEFEPCSTLDQVVVDSICIPEPATMGLLCLGLVALVRRRN